MLIGKKAFGMAAMAMAWGAPALGGLAAIGETTLYSVWPGMETVVVGYVDYMVLAPDDYTGTVYEALVLEITMGSTTLSDFLYTYQIESEILDGELFSVNVGVASNVISAGTAALDLDSVGHTIAGENEVAAAPIVLASDAPIAGNNNYTWDYAGMLDIAQESEINWFTSALAPTMSYASYADSIPPSPGIGMVASVVPAPSALALLGVFGLMGSRRRRG